MEGTKVGASSEPRSYTDIEPRSHWMHANEWDTLIMDVTGFRKDQMKVLIKTSGSLTISGERPQDGDGNQWLRFLQTFKVPKKCNPHEIQAKFDKDEGLLYVVLPKHKHAREESPSTKPSSHATHNEPEAQLSSPTSEEVGGERLEEEEEKKKKFGEGMSNLVTGLRGNKVSLVVAVMLIMVVLGIVAYLVYRLGRN
ncbi:uncharacterized protein A4U43_C07F33440 [Asparagus officinalis]|uniref:SHSP domain-containing protein n=1 Tax=Asparagus officinalis TaxID=4686 RepID=A0A5P1EGW5_ASPOF|nr:inactive protein RESTRICTED TEV MOVEMENT 2-like [Asparagus officinalis]ONK65084.1 uncharacterized protein A4U43_C07F33440 [Asparagus officinalis]